MAADGQVRLRRRRFEEPLVAFQVEFWLLGTAQQITPVACRSPLVGVAEQRAQPGAGFLLLLAEDPPLGESLFFPSVVAEFLVIGQLVLGAQPRSAVRTCRSWCRRCRSPGW
ncbi:hypothetical protein [Nonomuraea sp. NPDC049400]|uniref:hypothetical protein n=1 Tax=Nonomuraea sp. NPDC049400 TaxID=3364352 RepID=UPI0037BD1D27